MEHWRTNVVGWLKIAVACWYAFDKLKSGASLTEADMVIMAALGLGAAGNQVSADAKKVATDATEAPKS